MEHVQPIFEYSSDKTTLDISRAVVNRFKQFLNDDELPDPNDSSKVGFFELFGHRILVTITFIEGTKPLISAEFRTYEYNGKKELTIWLGLMYRPGNIKDDFNKLIVEIKDAVRHEIEHVGQYLKNPAFTPGSNKAKISWNSKAAVKASKSGDITGKDLYRYLMLDHEVEAHIKGIYKRAKTMRVDFEKLLHDWIEKQNISKLQKWWMKRKYYKYANDHSLFHMKPISKTYTQNNESKMNTPSVMSFKDFQSINEKGDPASSTGKGGLKALVGKGTGEDLNVVDAKRIGAKISKMSGNDRKKYIGIVNFMGASCKVFNTIWQNYKPVDKTRKTKNQGKEFSKPMSAPAA